MSALISFNFTDSSANVTSILQLPQQVCFLYHSNSLKSMTKTPCNWLLMQSEIWIYHISMNYSSHSVKNINTSGSVVGITVLYIIYMCCISDFQVQLSANAISSTFEVHAEHVGQVTSYLYSNNTDIARWVVQFLSFSEFQLYENFPRHISDRF